MTQRFTELANFIWSVADLLRGDYKQADYGNVILPFTLLRRLDCVLEATKKDVLAEFAKREESGAVRNPIPQQSNGYCSPDNSLLGYEFRFWSKNHLALYGVKNAVLAPGYRSPDQNKGEQ